MLIIYQTITRFIRISMVHANASRSIIDYFLATENLFPGVTDYRVLHHVDNLSDHNPFHTNIDGARIDYLDAEEMFVRNDKVSWKLAKPNDMETYKSVLDANLETILIPTDAVLCCDYDCHLHYENIELYYNEIVDGCMMAGTCAIPKAKGYRNETAIPGWNMYDGGNLRNP